MSDHIPTRVLRLGSRGSHLARAQTENVRVLLERAGVACEAVFITTSGDRILDRPLADIGGKGLFTKELETALLTGAIDLAVHSMKDVPAPLPAGTRLGAVLAREDARDAFVSLKATSLDCLAKGAKIGTSSIRREAQIRRARPDLEIVPLRGNVDTRLAKLDGGTFDAAVLAYAGLKRLGLEARATSLLPISDWLPALSQGIIGVQVRDNDYEVEQVLAPLNDASTAIAIACERGFQLALDGSCRSPIAGHATFSDGRLTFRGEVLAPDGSDCVATEFACDLQHDMMAEAEAAGRRAGLEIRPAAVAWLV
ncbi:MAG TPA: hydroxymethylbilane synthase [Rhizomicrobium sp.]|jgi:hydroxymethylbilane synthase|nr:hydroxymethylbilane synthase [Rhizomicrobium sp.]